MFRTAMLSVVAPSLLAMACASSPSIPSLPDTFIQPSNRLTAEEGQRLVREGQRMVEDADVEIRERKLEIEQSQMRRERGMERIERGRKAMEAALVGEQAAELEIKARKMREGALE